MTVALIVAISDNGVIGREGTLPWRLSADLKHFRRVTMGHTIVMGRRTFESIGRALPGRTSIVLTRQAGYAAPDGVIVAGSFDEAVARAGGADVFVIGGASVYREALPRASRLYVTRVHAEVAGDTHFPDAWLEGWQVVKERPVESDEKNEHSMTFFVLERAPREADPSRCDVSVDLT